MKFLILAIASSGLLAGCVQSNPAQTKIYTPVGTYKYHCPPGHAKKGDCAKPF